MNNCPICNEPLCNRLQLNNWYCPKKNAYGYGYIVYSQNSHYRYYCNSKKAHMYIYPYWILTHMNDECAGTSDIYVYENYLRYFRFVTNVPAIHPDTEEKLLQRIKTILLFS